ncbi:hypothetical protein PFNF54_01465, partial [Plasmodium falciparum NF54]
MIICPYDEKIIILLSHKSIVYIITNKNNDDLKNMFIIKELIFNSPIITTTWIDNYIFLIYFLNNELIFLSFAKPCRNLYFYKCINNYSHITSFFYKSRNLYISFKTKEIVCFKIRYYEIPLTVFKKVDKNKRSYIQTTEGNYIDAKYLFRKRPRYINTNHNQSNAKDDKDGNDVIREEEDFLRNNNKNFSDVKKRKKRNDKNNYEIIFNNILREIKTLENKISNNDYNIFYEDGEINKDELKNRLSARSLSVYNKYFNLNLLGHNNNKKKWIRQDIRNNMYHNKYNCVEEDVCINRYIEKESIFYEYDNNNNDNMLWSHLYFLKKKKKKKFDNFHYNDENVIKLLDFVSIINLHKYILNNITSFYIMSKYLFVLLDNGLLYYTKKNDDGKIYDFLELSNFYICYYKNINKIVDIKIINEHDIYYMDKKHILKNHSLKNNYLNIINTKEKIQSYNIFSMLENCTCIFLSLNDGSFYFINITKHKILLYENLQNFSNLGHNQIYCNFKKNKYIQYSVFNKLNEYIFNGYFYVQQYIIFFFLIYSTSHKKFFIYLVENIHIYILFKKIHQTNILYKNKEKNQNQNENIINMKRQKESSNYILYNFYLYKTLNKDYVCLLCSDKSVSYFYMFFFDLPREEEIKMYISDKKKKKKINNSNDNKKYIYNRSNKDNDNNYKENQKNEVENYHYDDDDDDNKSYPLYTRNIFFCSIKNTNIVYAKCIGNYMIVADYYLNITFYYIKDNFNNYYMSSGETPSSFFVSHKLEEPCVYKMKKKKEKQKYTCNMKEESESKIDYSTNHNMQNMMQRFFFLKRKKLKNKTEFNDNMIKEDKLEEKINEDFVITEEGEKKSNKKIKNNTQHNDNNNNNDVFICNSLYELLLNKEKSFFLNIKHGKLKYINERMHTSELTYIDIVTTNNILICISFNSVDYPLEINPHINIRYMPYLNNDIQYYYPLIIKGNNNYENNNNMYDLFLIKKKNFLLLRNNIKEDEEAIIKQKEKDHSTICNPKLIQNQQNDQTYNTKCVEENVFNVTINSNEHISFYLSKWIIEDNNTSYYINDSLIKNMNIVFLKIKNDISQNYTNRKRKNFFEDIVCMEKKYIENNKNNNEKMNIKVDININMNMPTHYNILKNKILLLNDVEKTKCIEPQNNNHNINNKEIEFKQISNMDKLNEEKTYILKDKNYIIHNKNTNYFFDNETIIFTFIKDNSSQNISLKKCLKIYQNKYYLQEKYEKKKKLEKKITYLRKQLNDLIKTNYQNEQMKIDRCTFFFDKKYINEEDILIYEYKKIKKKFKNTKKQKLYIINKLQKKCSILNKIDFLSAFKKNLYVVNFYNNQTGYKFCNYISYPSNKSNHLSNEKNKIKCLRFLQIKEFFFLHNIDKNNTLFFLKDYTDYIDRYLQDFSSLYFYHYYPCTNINLNFLYANLFNVNPLQGEVDDLRWNYLLYSPYELFTNSRKRLQCYILKILIEQKKKKFQNDFEILKEEKNHCLKEINFLINKLKSSLQDVEKYMSYNFSYYMNMKLFIKNQPWYDKGRIYNIPDAIKKDLLLKIQLNKLNMETKKDINKENYILQTKYNEQKENINVDTSTQYYNLKHDMKNTPSTNIFHNEETKEMTNSNLNKEHLEIYEIKKNVIINKLMDIKNYIFQINEKCEEFNKKLKNLHKQKRNVHKLIIIHELYCISIYSLLINEENKSEILRAVNIKREKIDILMGQLEGLIKDINTTKKYDNTIKLNNLMTEKKKKFEKKFLHECMNFDVLIEQKYENVIGFYYNSNKNIFLKKKIIQKHMQEANQIIQEIFELRKNITVSIK